MTSSEFKNSCDIYYNFPKVIDVNTPVVLILGWAGCQDRFLQKYSKLYEDKGFIIIRYSVSIQNVMWNINLAETAQNILEFIYSKKLEQHPLILHLFSNGGAFLYEHLLHKCKMDQMPIDIKGIIFDSGPGDRKLSTLFRVIHGIYGKTPFIGPIVAKFMSTMATILFIPMIHGLKLKQKFVGYIPGIDPYGTLLKDETPCPQLFIFSKSDDLISVNDVEYYANYRENLGIKVTKVCFENSTHVRHFTAHPDIYKSTIEKFISVCLNTKNTILTSLQSKL